MSQASSDLSLLANGPLDSDFHLGHPDHPIPHIAGTYWQASTRLGRTFKSEYVPPSGSSWRRIKTTKSFLAGREGTWIILQGYGAHTASLPSFSKLPEMIYHTWKVPFVGPAGISTKVNDFLHLRVARKSRLTSLVSLEQQRQFARLYPRLRTVWVPVAADTRWWTAGPADTDILTRLGVQPGRFLLCVGDIDREETVPVQLSKELQLPLVRVSRGKGAIDRSHEAAKKHGLTEFHGLVRIPYPELRDLHRSAWALLNAPKVTYHPAGLTTLTESMACGGVVLFPQGPTAEGYVTGGKEAILFDELTVESVLEACQPLLDEKTRLSIGIAARKRCEDFLNFENAGRLFSEAYEQAIT